MGKESRRDNFCRVREEQPYLLNHYGLELSIDEDVFPPDVGFTSVGLAETIQKYKSVSSALDIGTGCGLLGLVLAMQHSEIKVIGTDIHFPAINCARKNAARNQLEEKFFAVQTDLFSALSTDLKFDLIVFNHPYYPTIGKPVFGYNPDGGKEIILRFLSGVKRYLAKNGKIIMPYSSISTDEHNPMRYAKKLGFNANCVWLRKSEYEHAIYEFCVL